MSEGESNKDIGIDDEQLPEDLQASADNPLAEGLEQGETVGDLLAEGKGDQGEHDEKNKKNEDDEQDEESDSSQH